jgi:hypothetical protein
MSGIMRIPAHQVTPPLRALFDVGQPVAIRCFAVLDGSIRGQIWTNDPARPTSGIAPKTTSPRLAWLAGWGIRPKRSSGTLSGIRLTNRVIPNPEPTCYTSYTNPK